MASDDDRENNAPDSWEQELSDPTENGGGGGGAAADVKDVNESLSNLNVNAPVFIPGQNVHAPEFVPSFIPHNGEDDDEEDSAAAPHRDSSTSHGECDKPPDIIEHPKTMELDRTEEDQELEDLEDATVVDDWAENAQDDETVGSSEAAGADKMTKEDDASAKPKKKIKGLSIVQPKKEHVNVVFIGHVDAGKSTIGGHIMYLTGMVDKRTLEKYEKEAKEKNRETWYLSWALDTNLEEREKGKTVEVGRAYFETEKKHFTILDAPGHKSFVPNMIGGASQADLAVLVISARKGEFETGFERGGQTREHAMLAKTAGVKHLVVLVNKMDDPTVEWSEIRYTECKEKLLPYLKKCGFSPKSDIYFMPVSGLTGAYLKEPVSDSICPWYRGPPLIDYLNTLPSLNRASDGPVRVPVVDRYKDMGTLILGKVESGILSKNQTLTLMPNKVTVKVMQLWSDDNESELANSGENVKVKLQGVEEEDVSPGFVLCSPDNLCHTGKSFDAQIVILEHKSIICAGYSAILHIHTCAEEVTIKHLLCLIDKRTGEKIQLRPRFIKQDQAGLARIEVNGGMICLESFKDFPQMGRFTLRDEGKTIAIGKVLKVRD